MLKITNDKIIFGKLVNYYENLECRVNPEGDKAKKKELQF
jgi:hypothetical protein